MAKGGESRRTCSRTFRGGYLRAATGTMRTFIKALEVSFLPLRLIISIVR